MKFLLIEDEEKVVRSLKKGLNEHQIDLDFALDESQDGNCEANEYDVIIRYYRSGLNGTDLTRQLRERIHAPV
jgi:DNA-binding response OmpR family regulator